MSERSKGVERFKEYAPAIVIGLKDLKGLSSLKVSKSISSIKGLKRV